MRCEAQRCDESMEQASMPRRGGSVVSHRMTVAVSARFLMLMSSLTLAGYSYAALATGYFREVVPHRIYRSGQPSPERLRAWIDRYGLKTVVNLRGPKAPLVAENTAVAQSMGVETICIQISARKLIPSQELTRLIEVLETAPGPILLHCNHGVDRVGTASAIAAWLIGGESYRHAKWQAYVPPGPWKHKGRSPHVSDTFKVYEAYCRERDLNPDDPDGFKYWARYVYHPTAIASASH